MRSRMLGVGLLCAGWLLAGCGGDNNLAPTPPGPSFAIGLLNLLGPRATAAVGFDPGGPTVTWTAIANDGWLQVSPAAGAGPGTLALAADLTGRQPGEYRTAVRLATPLGTVLLQVAVAFTAPGTPNMAFEPSSLAFGTSAVTLTAQLVDHTGLGLPWSATELVGWAAVSPRTGQGTSTLTITVDRGRLPAGANAGTIRATFQGGAASLPITAGSTAAVATAEPSLAASPAALAFTAGGTTTATLNVTATPVSLAWTIASSAPWLTLSPVAGAGSGVVTVAVDSGGLGPGIHTATLRLDYAAAAGRQTGSASLLVPVTLTVPSPADTPQLALSPAVLIFGLADTTLPLALSNVAGVGALTWSAAASADWVTIAPGSGSGESVLQVTVDRANPSSAAGAAVVKVTSNGGTAAVEVVLARPVGTFGGATEPQLSVQPGLLDFGTVSTQQPLAIRNVGTAGLTWNLIPSAAWLNATPSSGAEDADVAVTINRSALVAGANIGSLLVLSNVGTRTVLVSATKPGGTATPQLLVNPTALDFGAGLTQLTFSIVNAGGGTLTWSVASSAGWLTAAPAAGTNGAQVTVAVDRGALPAGQQNAVLTISSDGGNANVQVSATGT